MFLNNTAAPYIGGLVQDCINSMANALGLLQSCTKSSRWRIPRFNIDSSPSCYLASPCTIKCEKVTNAILLTAPEVRDSRGSGCVCVSVWVCACVSVSVSVSVLWMCGCTIKMVFWSTFLGQQFINTCVIKVLLKRSRSFNRWLPSVCVGRCWSWFT